MPLSILMNCFVLFLSWLQRMFMFLTTLPLYNYKMYVTKIQSFSKYLYLANRNFMDSHIELSLSLHPTFYIFHLYDKCFLTLTKSGKKQAEVLLLSLNVVTLCRFFK